MEPQPAPTNPPQARRAASGHCLWAAGVGLLFVVLKLLPYWTTPFAQPDRLFLGFPYSVEDTLQYADLVAQARNGSFFFSNHFTLSGEIPRLGLLSLWLTGRLAAATGQSVAMAWMVAHGLLIFGFVLALYGFLGMFFPDRRWRWGAWLFVLFAGGLDGWVVLVKDLLPTWAVPVLKRDLWPVLGWTPYMTMYNPVYLAGWLTLLGFFWMLWRGLAGEKRWLGIASLWLGVMALVHPYDAVIGVGALLCALAHSLFVRLDPAAFRADLQKVLWLIPGLFLCWLWAKVESSDPLLVRITQASHSGLFVSPLVWFVGFGGILLFAFYGMRGLGDRDIRARLLFGWLVTATLLSFSPFYEGRHFLYFVSLPLGIVAVDGLRSLSARVRLVGRARWAVAVGLALLLGGSFVRETLRNFQVPATELRGFVYPHEWSLAKHLAELPRGGVLAARESGLWLPHLTGQRVVMGHWFMTTDMFAKQKMLDQLLDPATPPAERDRLFEGFGARYLFFGPRERALGPVPRTDKVRLLPLRQIGPSVLFVIDLPPKDSPSSAPPPDEKIDTAPGSG